jgi:hypothetical protein
MLDVISKDIINPDAIVSVEPTTINPTESTTDFTLPDHCRVFNPVAQVRVDPTSLNRAVAGRCQHTAGP